MLYVDNCIDVISRLPDESIDSIVTDPPYELGFMGKAWDSTGIAYSIELWRQCLRVLKPGGHMLAFSGSRTYHRMAVAIEDAGFDIRDQIMWVYGSGFPKSLNIGKQAGCEAWEGWGTALKPAHEPIVLARKPISGTIANNVLLHGTGALNIESSRVPFEEDVTFRPQRQTMAEGQINFGAGLVGKEIPMYKEGGRWPANFVHDGSDEVLELFPDAKGGTWNTTNGARPFNNNGEPTDYTSNGSDKSIGSAARFFYCAKASTAERNEGLEDFLPKRESDRVTDDGVGGDNPRNRSNKAKPNHHPTVKPIALMRHLVKLVTPPNGTVLDPFLGSGTTAVAATLDGFDWIGCEMNPEYAEIINARVKNAQTTANNG